MNTDDSIKSARDDVSPDMRRWSGMIRRMALRVTRRSTWQAIGHILLDRTQETVETEVFSGIGFYSRPPTGANAEAVIAFPGGAQNPIAIGLRDEDTRKKVAGGLAANETMAFNSVVVAHLRAGGTVEIRLAAGGPVQPTLLGTTYRSAEDAMLTAVSAAIALISNIPGLTAPQLAIVAAATTAISAFQAASASYLSTVIRVQ